MQGLVPAVAFLAIGLSVLAVFVPAFARNLRVSRLTEAVDSLAHISKQATLIAASRKPGDAYPPSVGLTPAEVPQAQAVTDTNRDLATPHVVGAGLCARAAAPVFFRVRKQQRSLGATFTARAKGDLDGDAILGEFEISGEYKPGERPVIFSLEMDREVE